MVKTPSTRHSKARKDPVTIDLEATRVPSESADTAAADAAQATAAASERPSQADFAPETAEAETPAAGASAGKSAFATSAAFATSPGSGDGKPTADASAEAAKSREPEKKPAASSKPDEPTTSGKTSAGAQSSTSAASDFGRNASAAASSRPGGTVPPAAEAPRRSAFSTIAAGIVGGVIALGGAGVLQYGGFLPSPGNRAGDAAAVDGLRAELTALRSEMASQQPGPDASGVQQAIADLQGKVDALAGDLGALRNAGDAGENPALAALDGKVAELQAQISQLAQGGAGAPVDLGPIDQKIAELQAGAKAVTDAVRAGDAKLTQIEQTLAALTGKVEAQADQPRIALSIATSSLKSAVDRGQPFAAELETLAAISPNLPQLTALRAHAEKGVASREALASELDAAAGAMIAAGKPVDPNAGVLDRLWESASSLVTVRPIGAVAGEGVPETVARMEADVKAGDLAKALAEYDTLPDAAKTAGSEFAARTKARLDVETLVDQAIADAMKTV
ncbi:COG4223 family protein [Arvimicrobium flavum]|uniref:COG4223 family protein n=1 Tax=Arvimicrobium flavum TaxID=3393320 RepID=UPI00237AFAEF|nr:phage tail protein [Mesorhizobium shangrilense]